MICAKCGEPVPEDDEEILGEVVFHRSKGCADDWLGQFSAALSEKGTPNENPPDTDAAS